MGLRRRHDSMADIVCQAGPGKEAGQARTGKADDRMTQLSEIYNARILELSANIPRAERLAERATRRRRRIPSCAARP